MKTHYVSLEVRLRVVGDYTPTEAAIQAQIALETSIDSQNIEITGTDVIASTEESD